MIELPPILTGDEQNQIQQLRDYLVRLALEPKEETAAANSSSTPTTEGTTDSGNANLNSRISGVDAKVSGMDEKISGMDGKISGMNSKLLTMWESIYPVGSIYMSVSSESPAALFGGTWEQIKDRFLLSAGDAYAAGATGGEAAHTLSVAEMPSHGHRVHVWDNAGTTANAWYYDGAEVKTHNGARLYNSGSSTWKNSGTEAAAAQSGHGDPSGTTVKVGGDQAHNNMPPYLAVYVWKRTA